MKTYIVYAERVTIETMEVQAMTEDEALEKAIEADNSEWHSESDTHWEITHAEET